MVEIHNEEILEQPLYSLDLAASDFDVFPNLKEHFHGIHLRDDETLMKQVNEWFAAQDKRNSEGVEALFLRYTKCVNAIIISKKSS